MLFFESKKYSYLKQFLILIFPFLIMGLLGGVFYLIQNKSGVNPAAQQEAMDKLLTKENANMLRFTNVFATFFLFMGPAFLYAKLCHNKARKHLGLLQPLQLKPIIGVIILMFSALFVVGLATKITEALPWSAGMKAYMKSLEDEYLKQIEVIGSMNNFGDYIISLLVIAIAPAIFEEVLFRGALQNLLVRWIKKPIIAIIITSLLFSAIHFSITGFLGRAVLGFVLGWIFYRTGNLWYSIIGHAFNNGLAVTIMYIVSIYNKNNSTAEVLNKMDKDFPWWVGIFGLVFIVSAFYFFEKIILKNNQQIIETNIDALDNKPDWMK